MILIILSVTALAEVLIATKKLIQIDINFGIQQPNCWSQD